MTLPTPIPASIEVVPRQVREADDLSDWFPAKTRVYLPDVGSEPFENMVEAAVRLRQAGYVPVPHFPARRIAGKTELAGRLERLSGEAQVNDILIIGGGLDKPVGEFTSTMDILDTGLLDNAGIEHIRVAGHPEGTPDFSDEMALRALRYKQDFHDRSDAELTIVTQFGFDPHAFIAWAEKLSEHGVRLPVHLGIAGPAKLTTLIKFAVMCGVGPSLQFLKKRATAITSLVSGYDPETMAGPVEAHVQTHANSPITQVHVFPFGGAKKAAAWLEERGSWGR